jgi:hypothetical protein
MPVGAPNATQQIHDHLGLSKRQLRSEHEACMPARRGGLKALVLLVSEFEEKHQPVRKGHERMFAYEGRVLAFDDPAPAALERAEAAELSHVREISLGSEGRRHSCEVANRRDFWMHSASERLSSG